MHDLSLTELPELCIVGSIGLLGLYWPVRALVVSAGAC